MSGIGLAALLLAGGASSRMGSPKALLDFGGRPLWRLQLEKLRALAPAQLFISAPRNLALPAGADWKILHDEQPHLGPLAGISAAHHVLSADWLVVLAIDMPAMTAGYLQQLCSAALATGRGQIPQLDGYHLGLAAVYPRAALEKVASQLRDPDRSLQKFVSAGIYAGLLASRPVPESERLLFANINHPEDYIRQANSDLR